MKVEHKKSLARYRLGEKKFFLEYFCKPRYKYCIRLPLLCSYLEIIANSDLVFEFDCNQEVSLVRDARPQFKLQLAMIASNDLRRTRMISSLLLLLFQDVKKLIRSEGRYPDRPILECLARIGEDLNHAVLWGSAWVNYLSLFYIPGREETASPLCPFFCFFLFYLVFLFLSRLL